MRVLARGFGVFALLLVCSSAQALSERNAQGPGVDAPAAASLEAAPSPSEHYRLLIDALIASDIEAIVTQLSGNNEEWLARDWERDRLSQAKSDRTLLLDSGVELFWASLASPERTAEFADALFSQFAEEADKTVAELNRDFAQTMGSIASGEDFSPGELQQVSQIALAAQRWANGMDWHDRARFDRALDAVAGFVRRSGAKTAGEFRLLPYEDAAALGDDAIATIKRVLREYDLDIDGMLSSVEVEELSRDGDEATLRWSARVFDVPIVAVREMRYERHYSKRWMTAKEFEQMARWRAAVEAEEAAEVARSAAPVTPSEPQQSGDAGSCGKSAGSDSEDQFWSEEK